MGSKLGAFQDKKIRRILHNPKWWFSVADVVEALADSSDPRQYIKKMRQRDAELNSNGGTICTPLELLAPDGKLRKISGFNTESGRIVGDAHEKLEFETGDKEVSEENYLTEPESRKRLTREKK